MIKYATVEEVMAIFPHPVLPTVQGEPDYQTIHATRKFLQANSRAIDTHLGGSTLGHLCLIMYDASYAIVYPTTDAVPTLWTTSQVPWWEPSNRDGAAAQISATHHIWEEDVQTYRTYTSVQHALKKQISSVFEPMYLDILNDGMVGYANILARDMLDHLFETYGNITAVDLEINFEHMRRAWDPQQPVESLFKQIQDCADYSEAGGVLICHPQQMIGVYEKNCHRSLHECMSSVERETYHQKNLDPIQIPLCVSSPSTQENAGRIRCHNWIPLCKCRRCPQRGSNV
jgi:hypothetical protein